MLDANMSFVIDEMHKIHNFTAIELYPTNTGILISSLVQFSSKKKKEKMKEFPGSPVVKTLHSHCLGPGFNPWSGN